MPAARLPFRRLIVAALAGLVVLPVVGTPAPAAAEEDVAPGDVVVGELVQAWPEHEGHEAEERADEAPLSWIETDSGEAVRVSTDDLAASVPADVEAGATIEVVVGAEVADEATVEEGLAPAREVLSAEVLEAAPSDEPLGAGTTNQVTVVMMVPAGASAEPGRTWEQVVAAVDGPVAEYWRGQSGGAVQLSVVGTKYDWATTTASCSDPYALWNAAATRAGWTAGPGKHLLVYVPRNTPGCSYGLATVGAGTGSGGRLYVQDVATSVLAHEFGHNFGLGHSSARQCDQGTETGSCRDVAYRDYYDVMGVSGPWVGSLNAPQAARIGVLPPTAQVSLTVDGSASSHTLSPYSGTTGTRAVRLTTSAGTVYWLEYRTATGQDSWLSTSLNAYGLQQGVQLRRAGSGADTSMLLDGTPSASGSWGDDWATVLPVGTDLLVAGDEFLVTVESVSAQGAVVRVSSDPSDRPTLPRASWDELTVAGPVVTVTGWSVDLNARQTAAEVHVYVDGAAYAVVADRSRPDVGAAVAGAGDAHGFSWSTTVTPGAHTVCVYAIDVDQPWRNTPLGCRSITTQMTLPRANWEVLGAADGVIEVAGWALDPDDPTRSSQVHVYLDGRGTAVTADGSRPDVGAAFPGAGQAHGFRWAAAAQPGRHNVCVFAIDIDQFWRNTPLGCRAVTVGLAPPIGNWEVLSAVGTTLTVAGWTLDPDSPRAAGQVHVYVDGRGSAITADGSRPDVGAAFPHAGSGHGFSWAAQLTPGRHSICLYAIDVALPWSNTPLGCRSIAVAMTAPRANWEVLAASGSTLTVSGWSFDPDSATAAGQVHVYVDGQGAAVTANGSRPDVGAAFPGVGDDHGFTYSRSVAAGPHTVCVYAIDDQISWLNTPLGCRSITT